MAKEFDPDQFLQQTAVIAEDQSEIEKKNQAQTSGAGVPSQAMGPGPVDPSMLDQAGNFITQTAIPTAFGVGKAVTDIATANPVPASIAASYIPGINKLPGISTIKSGREAATNILNRFAGTPPTASAPMGSPGNPIGGAPTNVPTAQQPSMIQRGMDTASRMRQLAAQRVVGFGASGAAVPAAVAAVPGAMMYDAYKNYQTQTPEQRKQSAMEALSGQGMGQAGIY